jgi:chloramphenicol 3-O-phosphotransferase
MGAGQIRADVATVAGIKNPMAKIIWINGAFGSGKTTCAYELHRRMPGSFVYDPENIGCWIRRDSPQSLHSEDFQDHPQWRCFNCEMLNWLATEFDGAIIVPMTLISRQYYNEIIRKLIGGGVSVRHFILGANRETLLKRLSRRLERGDTWAKVKIDRCLTAFERDITETKIETDNRPVDEIVAEIAALCELELAPDKRGKLHTTPMGAERIKSNLCLETDVAVLRSARN